MFSVVIPSRNTRNLSACIAALHDCDPGHHTVIIDDGIGLNPWPEILDGTDIIRGEKPFVFARNANIGLRRAFELGSEAAILLNDDTRLLTADGFGMLAKLSLESGEAGAKAVIAPSLTGSVGNQNQVHVPGQRLRKEPRMLCFVAVCITAKAWAEVGPLDERYSDYGMDDDDWCWTARSKGYQLYVWDGCVVEHGKLESTFRPGNTGRSFAANHELFKQKWGHDNHGRPV